MTHVFILFVNTWSHCFTCLVFFLRIRRPPRSTLSSSSAASDVYKRQVYDRALLVAREAVFVTNTMKCEDVLNEYAAAIGTLMGEEERSDVQECVSRLIGEMIEMVACSQGEKEEVNLRVLGVLGTFPLIWPAVLDGIRMIMRRGGQMKAMNTLVAFVLMDQNPALATLRPHLLAELTILAQYEHEALDTVLGLHLARLLCVVCVPDWSYQASAEVTSICDAVPMLCDIETDLSRGRSLRAYQACLVATIDLAAQKRRILVALSLIHISEPTRLLSISYAVFCLKKKKKIKHTMK
eukprot:TRINITY_DN51564_c0_g1_i1.p1 TRINITY_DN51564_c0_g1~~TRINITY_DN51564_c0_g1_i1.p1  ORF type:complete len:295 (+),score=39.34 TRINITY_DN51564_c0_g1_i1:17-901(+)